MTERKRHQYVFVDSSPAGALILYEGQKVGTTPALVYLPRSSKAQLEVQREAKTQTVPLKVKYRWGESFWSNFAFLTWAPLGWGIDLVTGNAWSFTDPEQIRFPEQSSVESTETKILIAPPQASHFSLSDEAAQYWEKKLSENDPQAQVIPYQSTLDVFQKAGFEYDGGVDQQREREILYKTQAQQMFVSEVQENREGRIGLQGEIKNLKGDTLTRLSSENMSGTTSLIDESWVKRLGSWIQLVPNTVGLEMANTKTALSDGIREYESKDANDHSFWNESFRYLQAITITHLDTPRMNGVGRWKFQFTSAARFSYSKITFPDFPTMSAVNFGYFQAGAGFGPEFGYQAGPHYAYVKIIPLLNFAQLDWSKPGGGSERISNLDLGSQAELGYLYFINNNLSLKIFSKSTSTADDLWKEAAHRIDSSGPDITASSDIYGGVAIGYTFDISRKLVQD